MSEILFILNDPPYGTERSFNGLRLAGALSKRKDTGVKVFLMGDAASCAKKQQKVPQGYYNLEVMIRSVIRHEGKVGICGGCMDARGIAEDELIEDTKKSSLNELADWTQAATKVLIF
jgi:uncharacterized protein involved in oxidation of intracellular sulfur|tara:strand:- start:28838 stop:29191 length:354 start_codon:yes stop_codon:yes gene_type:complete